MHAYHPGRRSTSLKAPSAVFKGGDEENRINRLAHPPRIDQVESRAIGTRLPVYLGTRRGTVTSRDSDQLGTFDSDAPPAFQGVTPAAPRRPRYRACDTSPPLPINDETGVDVDPRKRS